jgi:hypothetical protein
MTFKISKVNVNCARVTVLDTPLNNLYLCTEITKSNIGKKSTFNEKAESSEKQGDDGKAETKETDAKTAERRHSIYIFACVCVCVGGCVCMCIAALRKRDKK